MKIVEPVYDWTRSECAQYTTPEGAHWKTTSEIFHETEFVVRDYTIEVMYQVRQLITELRIEHDFDSA